MDPNAIGAQFTATAGAYATAIQPYATRLFFGLLFIEVLVTSIQYVIDQSDASRYLGRTLRHVLSAAFIYLMLVNAFTWMGAIMNSFAGIGSAVSGIPNLNPGTVLGIGGTMAETIFSSPTNPGGFVSDVSLALGELAAGLLVLLAFTTIAALALLVVVEAYLVIGGASILLAFGGSRFTAPIAEGYFGYVIKVGTRLLFFYLVLGIGMRIASSWSTTIAAACVPTTTTLPWFATYGVPPSSIITTTCSQPLNWHLLLMLVANSIVLMVVTIAVPNTAAAIVSGTAGLALSHAFEAAFVARTIIQPVSNIMQTTLSRAVRAFGGRDDSLDGRFRANERYRPQPLSAPSSQSSSSPPTAGTTPLPDPNTSTEILDAKRTRAIQRSTGPSNPSTVGFGSKGSQRPTNNLGVGSRGTAKI
jgi:P-type conjugative transfer protein TrbL